MRLGRRLLRSAVGQRLTARLISAYVRLVRATARWTIVGGADARALWSRRETLIGAFWHGRLLLIAHPWPASVPVAALISHHRDGEIIARAIANLGLAAVRGSSSRGATGAGRSILKALGEGTSIVLTPDGPRGPRMRASEGIVAIAQLSGRPIVPASYSAAPAFLLRSWDRFLVPLPFARCVYLFGTPIEVPKDADAGTIERLRLEVETQLNDLTAEADRRAGRAPVEPAPVPE